MVENGISQQLEIIKEAAKGGKWEIVEEYLPMLANNPAILGWAAQEGLIHPHDDLRDLGASIFEASYVDLAPDVIAKLQIMLDDPYIYARFRAACALHRHDYISNKVVAVITAVRDDPDEEPDVREIARGYEPEKE